MKKLILLSVLSSTLLMSCVKYQISKPYINGYGVFLGAHDEDIDKILSFDAVAIDLDEFSSSSIKKLKDNDVKIYAYLSIGSLEKYRSYYEEFKDITFMDYDNWPDERWVDVSNSGWQNHISSEADRLSNLGADGLFMDNFDVYYIANEEYECTNDFKVGIYNGCHTILDDLSKKDLDLMINSGTDFLMKLDENEDNLINSIDVYAQECVFSNILDYEKDIFGKQEKEQQDYLFECIDLMKNKSKVLLIEYTVDDSVIDDVINYSKKNGFYYYISSKVGLTA